MNVNFDIFGNPEAPTITLCNPNGEELYFLKPAYNTLLTLRYNAMSEFSFDFPESIDGGQTANEAYYHLKNKKVVRVGDYGNFQIVNAEENVDGSVGVKKVECFSLENELVSKRVTVYGGTKQLYNPITPEGTILQDMLDLAPAWSIEYVDGDLLGLYRTFDVSDTSVYEFLMNEVETAFNCVFFFDTLNRRITVKHTNNAVTSTDIFMSFDNLIKQSKFSEKSDEITTCLSVYGGGDLDIRGVNPLGNNKIYNFDYYKNEDWMSSGLIDAINVWEARIVAKSLEYADNLLFLKTANAELIVLNGEMADLEAEYAALEEIKAARIQGGQSFSDINAQLAAKQVEIDSKQIEITNKETEIASYTTILNGIVNFLSFSNNFTPEQYVELSVFIFENTYKNDTIIQTDSMTDVEVQEAQESLLEQALIVLEKISRPRYEIEIDSVNYIDQEVFSIFTNQTVLGASVTAEVKDIDQLPQRPVVNMQEDSYTPTAYKNVGYVTTVLLEIEMSFDDPEKFKLTFSNRLRLDGGNFIYSDLNGQSVKMGSSVSFGSSGWSNWENNYKDSVSTFITSALDATVNNIVSNTNQEIKIDQTGLRGRKFDPATEQYKPEQVWLTNNVLAFSSDGFNTAKLALGKILTPSGSYAFGLVAETIVGRLLAGNSLTITNQNNTFTVDGSGATLTNAKFTVNTTNAKIIIDPTSTISFRIQKNQGGTFVDKFWVDNTGNVNFSGALSGATGTFSGSLSAATGTFAGSLTAATGTFAGALSAATGTFRGQLQAATGSFSGDISAASGTFSGNIYADKIFGQVVDTQIASGLDAGKITVGTMSADRIYGGAIRWPGVVMYSPDYGISTIETDGYIELLAGLSKVSVDSGGVVMNGISLIQISAPSLNLIGQIYTRVGPDEGYGITGTINPNSYNNFYFVNGILVDYY